MANLLSRRGRVPVDILPPIILRPGPKLSRSEAILSASRDAFGHHILFIHADADAPTRDKAFAERIEPGLRQVWKASKQGKDVCTELIPIIPVQATEAWLLADMQALGNLIGANLPSLSPQQIERVSQPKERLRQLAIQALTRRTRRRRFDIGELYEPLARYLDLKQLERLPAYQQFASDLTSTLFKLGLLV